MNAVIYTRVSTEEQAGKNNYSLAAQKRICEQYAKANGYKVVKLFEDAGKSATSIKGRPALNELLSFIEDNKIDYILIQDTDRIARNTQDHLLLKATFKKNNVNLVSVSQPNLDDSVEGKLIDTIVASINQFQSDLTGRKTKKGLEQKANNGWLPSKAPQGYLNVQRNGKNIIIIDKDRGPLIKLAFDLYISGKYGVETINEILYQKGYRSLSGRKLQVSKMYHILENPFYYGDFMWDHRLFKGKHEPIISKNVWMLAQQIRKSRTVNKDYERKHQFLLSGFIFCECGRRFTAEHHFKKNKTYSYYHCTSGKKCNESVNIPIKELENQVEERFKEISFTNSFFEKILIRLKEHHQNFHKTVEQEILKLTKNLSIIKKNSNRIEDLLIAKTITADIYQKKEKQYREEAECIENEIFSLKRKKDVCIKEFSEVAEFSRNIYRNYKNGKYDIKRMYLGFFWEKFIVQNNQIIKAVPTPIFRALRKIQKTPGRESFVFNVEKGFINPIERGDLGESNPYHRYHKPVF